MVIRYICALCFILRNRYLVIIDDLWSRTEWTTIKCCFPDNNLGSRIMITTRNDALAKDCSSGSSEYIYKIDLLSDTDSRNLFLKKVFGNVDSCPQHLEDVFSKIMRRCGGLPLATASVAGVLSHQSSKDEWERFGSNLLSSSHIDGLKQILHLSYNDLPPHLKTCLLYLSIFPENYEIDIEGLVRRWIAEGIIGEARRESTEETARCYLSELISRNMVQPLHLKHDGTTRSCTVHPVIHDFIVVKSMEENFVTLVDVQKKDFSTNHGTVRRLSLQNNSKQDQAVVQNDAMKHARSVTVFGHASGAPRLTDLRVLRVLDLEGCEGPVCLDGLCVLVLLRYLSLRGTDVSELPAQLGDLRCLETLDVRFTKVKELPPSIVKLEKLMHLLVGSAKLPHGMGKMNALLTLSCADITTNSVNVMQELIEHSNLRELELFCDVTQMSVDKKRVTFPSGGFRSLKQLCIRCSLPSVTFETGALPKVEVLELKFEKCLSDESSRVSGIEHLPSLTHVFIEFSQHDAGVAATDAAVRTAAETVHPNRPDVTVKVDGKSN